MVPETEEALRKCQPQDGDAEQVKRPDQALLLLEREARVRP